MDPAADYLFGPGLADFLPRDPKDLIPLLMQVNDEPALAVVNALLSRRVRGLRADAVFLLPGFAQPGKPPVVALGEYAPLLAPLAFFEALLLGGELEPLRAGAKRIQLGVPVQTARLNAPRLDGSEPPVQAPDVQPPEGGWPRGTVVLGIIDDGIAFAHELFRAGDGTTRIQAFWHQDGTPKPNPTVSTGNEISKAEMDALMQGPWVDEDRAYRKAGLEDFTNNRHKTVALRMAHGTAVLGLAAGYPPSQNRVDRPIIAVQLPAADTAAQSGAGLEPDVTTALLYILDRAARLTAPGEPLLPVVINFSYGVHTGPHDGTSVIEQAVEQAIQGANRTVRVALPSGNANLSRCHAQLAFQGAGTELALPLRVQPDDRTPSTVEVWLPFDTPAAPAASRVSLQLEAPDGTRSPWIGEAPGQAFGFGPQDTASAVYQFIPAPTARGVFRITIVPTVRVWPGPDAPGAPVAPSGLWVIRLRDASLRPQDLVQAWVERDDLLPGYPRLGRQAYFEDPRYHRFNAESFVIEDDPPKPLDRPAVRRAGTISGVATGLHPAVAGGFAAKELRMAPYSAGGPITLAAGVPPNPAHRKPDLAWISDSSRAHAGVFTAGSRSASVVAVNGTSVAAPQLARWLADQVAAGLPSDRAAVRAMAEAAEAQLPPRKWPLPLDRGGWGRAGTAGFGKGPRARVWI